MDVGLRELLDHEVLVAADRLDLVGAEVARDVDVALLEQQALRRRLGDVAHDHPLHRGRPEAIVGVGLHGDRLGRLPALELERAGARGMGLQPFVAEVVAFGIRQHQLLVDHRAHARGQAVEHEGRREVVADRELDRILALGLDHALDVVLGPAELGQDEGRREVELDHPLQRERHILGAHRVAGVELEAGADLEGDRAAVVADAVALGDARHQLCRVLGLVGHDPVIELVDHLAARELEHLGRVERDDVVDVLGDHQRVRGRRRAQGGRRPCHQRACQQRSRCPTDACPDHDLPPADPFAGPDPGPVAAPAPRSSRVGRLIRPRRRIGRSLDHRPGPPTRATERLNGRAASLRPIRRAGCPSAGNRRLCRAAAARWTWRARRRSSRRS